MVSKEDDLSSDGGQVNIEQINWKAEVAVLPPSAKFMAKFPSHCPKASYPNLNYTHVPCQKQREAVVLLNSRKSQVRVPSPFCRAAEARCYSSPMSAEVIVAMIFASTSQLVPRQSYPKSLT